MQSSLTARTAPLAAGGRSRRPHAQCMAAGSTANKVTVKVMLKIPYRVNFGQTVAVVGTGELLGSWDASKAVHMNWAAGDFWVAEISVEPGSATQLEYKYVVLNSNGTISHWKPGQNYKLDVLAARGTRVLVTETWDDGPRHVEVDMENSEPPAPANTTATASTSAPAKQAKQSSSSSSSSSNGSHAPGSNGAAPSANGSSNGKAAAAPEATAAHKNGKSRPPAQGAAAAAAATPAPASPAQAASTSSSVPQSVPEPGPSAVAPSSPAPLSGAAIIQQEAQAAMSELKDALDRQVNTLQRVPDPTAIEVLMGDRLLAAANSKAVALNRAVRAAEALPMLPPGADVTPRSTSPPPPQQQAAAAGGNGKQRSAS